MTASTLLAVICGALLVQLMVVIVVAARRTAAQRVREPLAELAPDKATNLAWGGLRAFRVARRTPEDATASQVSFYLEPVDGLPLAPYRAGQFLTFQVDLPGATDAARTATRCYSLSDQHDPAAYRVTIKRNLAPIDRPGIPPGLVSGYFHDHVAPGTILQVRAPAGGFVLGDDPGTTVLIAGGIGITPLFAMARAALAVQPDRALYLFYGVRNCDEMVFAADLSAMQAQFLNFHLVVVQSGPLPGSGEGDLTGYIDVETLRRRLPHGEHHFYLCGPPPMMTTLVAALRVWGVAGDAIHYEAFGPASLVESAESAVPLAQPFEVQFARTGRTLAWTGKDTSLLDFAERNGISVDAACRSGSCGTCETGLTSGEVRYARPPAFDVGAGRCLLCVGVPTSDLVLAA